MRNIDELLKLTLSLDGNKILTLIDCSSYPDFTTEINTQGVFSNRELFISKLRKVANNAGGLHVEQIVPVKVSGVTRRGKHLYTTRSNMYGAMLFKNGWSPISKEELKHTFTVEHNTGKVYLIKDVYYKEFK